MKALFAIAAALALGFVAFSFWPGSKVQATEPTLATVTVPESFSEAAKLGQMAYTVKCSMCHGENAAGQDGVAPPLVHIIYEPNHHGDESFQRAAAVGVRAHHWPLGDMPPVDGLTREEVKTIIAYIRELQRANGIQ